MTESMSNSASGLVYALEKRNYSLIKQLLEEIADTKEHGNSIPERIDEVTDLIDRLLYSSDIPEPSLKTLKGSSVAALCELVQASEPTVLKERSPLLLPYLINAFDDETAGLSTSLWLLWLADRRTAEESLREHGLTSNKASVRLASIGELSKWIEAMNGRFAFRKFTATVVGLLRDVDADVRSAAYALIVKFFATAKQPAKDDLIDIMKRQQFNDRIIQKLVLAVNGSVLPENSANELEPKISRSSSPSPAMGTAIPVPGSLPTNLSEYSSSSSLSSSSSDTASPKQVKSLRSTAGSNSTIELECLKDPQYEMQSITPLDKNIKSDGEFLSEISAMLPLVEGKESEYNWTSRQHVMRDYRKMLRSTAHKPTQLAIYEAFKLLQRPISEILLSMRTTLVTDTCQAIKDSCQLMSGTSVYHELFDPLLDSLCKVATGIKKITAAMAHLTICAVLIESPSSISPRHIAIILQESKSLKPHARAYAFYWLKAKILTSSITSLASYESSLENVVLKAINDAAPAGRAQGRDLFWALDSILPDCASKISSKLGAAALKNVYAGKPRNSAPSLHPNSIAHMKVKAPTSAKQFDNRNIPNAFSSLGQTDSKITASPPRTPAPEIKGAITERKTPPFMLKLSNSKASLKDSASSDGAITPTASNISGASRSSHSSNEDSVSRSIADLSVHDDEELNSGGEFGINHVDTGSPLPIPRSSIRSSSSSIFGFTNSKHANNVAGASAQEVGRMLQQLATAKVSLDMKKSTLETIKENHPQISSSAAIAKIIQMDVESSSRSQREGYLQLLRLLDYEIDGPVDQKSASASNHVIRFPEARSGNWQGNANLPTDGHIRESIYNDSETDEDISNSSSYVSFSSIISPESSTSSSYTPGNKKHMINGDFLGPFPTGIVECKSIINSMVTQVKQGNATMDSLAALAVLITASSNPTVPIQSPIRTAVTIWRQHFTLDMQLRDAILPFLEQRSHQLAIEQIVVGLILLRSLLSTDAPHAAVYLEGSDCLHTLFVISENFGSCSLEIDNHLLPDIGRLILEDTNAKRLSCSPCIEILLSQVDKDKSEVRLLCVKLANQVIQICASDIDNDARGKLLQIVAKGLEDKDVRVRKEVYTMLLEAHRRYPAFLGSATENMTSGQQQLLDFYINEAVA